MISNKELYTEQEQLTLTHEELQELEQIEINQSIININQSNMQTNDFLPQGYEAPKATAGGYLKFKNASTKFRIVSSPIIGYEGWSNDNKPVRFKEQPKAESLKMLRDNKAKHFWALIVWSYADEQVMILQITQSSIIEGITALAKDEAWGNPKEYDITVNKTGQGMETKYTVVPAPPRPLAEDVIATITEDSANINLEALFTNDNPFG